MPNTYVLIASTTVGAGGASSIDFTSIPSTYTDLLVKLSVRGDAASGGGGTYHNVVMRMKINSATTNYSSRDIIGLYDSGGTRAASQSSSTSAITDLYINNSGGTANTFSSVEMYFPNYAGSTNKSLSVDSVEENNISTGSYYSWWLQLIAGLWSNTAAITTLSFTPASGNFVQYSTATLYGIKNS